MGFERDFPYALYQMFSAVGVPIIIASRSLTLLTYQKQLSVADFKTSNAGDLIGRMSVIFFNLDFI